jgi:hypothetical protein
MQASEGVVFMPLDVVAENPFQAQLAALRNLVMGDAALQARLAACRERNDFVSVLVETARSLEAHLAADHIAASVRADPLGLDRFLAPAWGPPPAPQAGWLPSQVSLADGRPVVDWVRFGEARLTDSFYENSVRWALSSPFNNLFRFRTPLDDLTRWGQDLPSVQPAGFIFHMSRCGSTLAAQMLAQPAANIVVSEAAPIDGAAQLAHADPAFAGPPGLALLRDMIGVFGQVREPAARRLFVKMDCWHALMLPLFRRAFPDTPWVFLYREPVEVMVSQMRQRGSQMVPEFVPPSFYGIDLPDGVPSEDYCAQVLAATCQGALDGYALGGGLVVNYRELPEAMFTKILPHFGVAPTPEEHDQMSRAMRIDAKAPGFAFQPDSAAKRAEAKPAIAEICERRLSGVYRRLEEIRAGQG